MAIVYKPPVIKPTAYPKTARRFISLGAYIILLALLIGISAKIAGALSIESSIESASQSPLTHQATATILSSLSFAIVIYIIVAIAIFLAVLFVSFRLKTRNITQINKYSKVALAMAIITVVSVIVMTLLFENYGLQFVTSNSATILPALAGGSGLSTSISNLSGIIILMSLIDFTLLVVGIAFLLLGSLFGLAYSKNISAIKYISTNWKPILYLFVIVIIVYAAISLYSSYQISTDNKMALNSLNTKIHAYGGNLRYMLANKSAFYSAITTNTSPTNYSYLQIETTYQGLVAMSNTQQNITSVLTLAKLASRNGSIQSQINSSSLQGVNKADWYTYNPLVRLIELTAFDSLHIFAGTAITSQNQQEIIPEKVSPLQSTYELQGMVINLFYISQVLVSLFHNNYFGSLPSKNQTTTSNDLGIGLALPPPRIGSTITFTTMLNGNFYDSLSLGSLANDWLASIYSINVIEHGFPRINNNTATHNLFYRLALTEYASYFWTAMFYNKTISPNLDFFGYTNNTSILNLGNINLTNPQITLYIDGNQTTFTRYYNYLVVYNKHLSMGAHELTVVIGNQTLSSTTFISPTIPTSVLLSGTYQNHTYEGVLSFNIHNPYPSPLNITNLSIVGTINPPPSITPSNLSDLIYNASITNTITPTLQSVTYSKFNFYQNEYNNYTNSNYTIANYTRYRLPISSQYKINKTNDYLHFNYTVSFNLTAGSVQVYTITFDTNHGKMHAIV